MCDQSYFKSWFIPPLTNFLLFLLFLQNIFVLYIWRLFYSEFFKIVLFWTFGNPDIVISTSALTLTSPLRKLKKANWVFGSTCALIFQKFLKLPSELSAANLFLEPTCEFFKKLFWAAEREVYRNTLSQEFSKLAGLRFTKKELP